MTAGNQGIVCIGILMSFFAVEKGPVLLASAITNIRPAFVFLIAIVLSRFFPGVVNERISKGTTILKFSAIAIIIGGVTLLTLTSQGTFCYSLLINFRASSLKVSVLPAPRQILVSNRKPKSSGTGIDILVARLAPSIRRDDTKPFQLLL